jgi:AraC family transcriptional activator of pobA
VARFRELVEAGYRTNRTLGAYASDLGVSVWTLGAACRGVASASPLGLVQDRKMLEARRALLYSNMTVAEIAYYLGFDDPAYFTRVFTKHAGSSPRAFRDGALA